MQVLPKVLVAQPRRTWKELVDQWALELAVEASQLQHYSRQKVPPELRVVALGPLLW